VNFKIVISVLFFAGIASVTGSANAGPSGAEICRKMIADGRGGDLDQSMCLCTYRVAVAVFDDDIKALLFDSWYNGTNNMSALEKLPGQSRVKKQFRTMKRTLKKNCP